MSGLQARRTLTAYLFLTPAILFFLVFLVGPMLFGLFISTRDWNMLQSPFLARDVGLNNYRNLLGDDEVFRLSLTNTFLYAVGTMLPLIVLALLLALVLNQRVAMRALFRTAYFVPVVTSAVAVSIVWGYLYNPVYGPINAALDRLGSPTPHWLTSAELALPAVMVMGVWKGVGYYMVIFLAGLQNVPREYYEAARVDGASPRHTFWHITLPLLKPTTMFVFITAAIHALQVFTPVFILTHGGPANASNVLVLYMYDTAFLYLKMGRAAAMAFVLFVILLVVTLVQLRCFREGGVRSY